MSPVCICTAAEKEKQFNEFLILHTLQVTYVNNKVIQTRRGGLCVIHWDTITLKPHCPSSFECQLVTLNLSGSTKQVTCTNQASQILNILIYSHCITIDLLHSRTRRWTLPQSSSVDDENETAAASSTYQCGKRSLPCNNVWSPPDQTVGLQLWTYSQPTSDAPLQWN